ncbi:hypothetical protein [Sutcliffiella deserti]|uniref:hypothetical protein n=1 Tax=Sutcliffiella deserti TaxID=2875501 RepID=UPI001CBACAB5|nr:hypothetical protein [Sutcliffiella deserti]
MTIFFLLKEIPYYAVQSRPALFILLQKHPTITIDSMPSFTCTSTWMRYPSNPF